jgi:transposase
MAKPRNFTDQFKAKVALEALRGDKTVQEIAAKHQLHPNQVSTWKRQAIAAMADVFSGSKQSGPTEAEVKELHAKIGRLAVENDFCRKGSKGEPGKEARDDPAGPSKAEHQPAMQTSATQLVGLLLRPGWD